MRAAYWWCTAHAGAQRHRGHPPGVAEDPTIRVLILTVVEDDDSVFAAMRAGARDYVLKGTRQGDLLRVVQAVSNGDAIFSPSIAARVIGYFSSAPERPSSHFRA